MNESQNPLERAKAYQKIRQNLQLIELVLTPAILFLTVRLPISQHLKLWALHLTHQPYGVVALYFVFYTVFMLVIDFPLTVYSGYFLEKKFELSNHSFGGWGIDFLKKSLLSSGFSLVLIAALYFFIWHDPARWWVFAWAGFAGVSYILGKLFPVMIVPLFYKYGPVQDEGLKKRILDLATRYGLPVENVYSLNLSRTTKKANAAFMGMGKTKRVVLSDTLMEHFSADEIETVVAHELGHFKHQDIWKQLVMGMASSLIGFWIVSRSLDRAAVYFGFEGIGDVAALPLLFLIFYGFYLVLTPLQNGFSRILERAADRFALKAFPRPEIFISCMEKLAKVNLADPDPHPLIEWFFHDHPAISKRIRMAKAFKSLNRK